MLIVFLGACAARAPRMPGPLGPVGQGPVLPGPSERSEPLVEITPTPEAPKASRFGAAVAEAARHWLDHRPRGFRDDCSGFVMASLDRAGLPLAGNTASFWELAREHGAVHRHKEPRVGDLAFFDDTYDRNGNGRLDDELSHIAVVIDVAKDGTVLMAHSGTSRGRTTLTMNLHHPDVRHAEDGAVLNDYLRAKRSGDPKGTRYLAGELWRGFATLDPDAVASP